MSNRKKSSKKVGMKVEKTEKEEEEEVEALKRELEDEMKSKDDIEAATLELVILNDLP